MFSPVRSAILTFSVCALATVGQASAQPAAPNLSLIDRSMVSEIKSILAKEIVVLSVENQNTKYRSKSLEDIKALDATWVAESKADSKPLIASTLSNPLSAYLTRVQARSVGLYTEIFVMDDKGLNVGQSSISSDYWQGDEAKFQKTFPVGPDAVFVDEPEWNDDTKTWRAQVNVSIPGAQDNAAIGAATFEVNLTELERRQ